MKSLPATIAGMWKAFLGAPVLFLLLQLPEVSVDWIDRAFRQSFEAHPFLGAVTLFPYFTIVSAVSTALTALAAAEIQAGRRPSLSRVWQLLGPRLGLLIKTSLISGLFIILGMPILVPAVYFMTVYLLVPVLVVFEPRAGSLSLLARSKNLVRPRFWPVLSFTFFFLAVGVGMFLVQGEMDKRLIDQMGYPVIMGAVIDTVFSIALGVGVNLGIYEIYRWLKGQSAISPSSNDATSSAANT